MKKIISIIIVIILLCTYSFSFAQELNLSAESAILMDYDTLEILYEKNSHLKLYPASTTKTMTAILAMELGNLDDVIIVDEEVINLTAGSHIALDYDEEMTLKDLLHALLIQSANDAALAIGKYVSGSIDDFVKLMNEKAVELGALNTNFVNPNGLHDDKHVSTAYDLALIGKYAMEKELFRSIISKPTYVIGPTNKKTESRTLLSTNLFISGNENINYEGKTIPIKLDGVIGGKTGTTPQAKNCLMLVTEQDNRRLLTVVLKSNGKEVYADTHKLINYGLDNFQNATLGYANEFMGNFQLENATLPFVAGILDKDFSYPILKENIGKVEKRTIINEELQFPISLGAVLGNEEYYLDGKLLGSTNIISTAEVDQIPPLTWINYIMQYWYILVFIFLIAIRIISLIAKRKIRTRRKSERRIYSYPIK